MTYELRLNAKNRLAESILEINSDVLERFTYGPIEDGRIAHKIARFYQMAGVYPLWEYQRCKWWAFRYPQRRYDA